jgi:multiple antibiotic resistance protein
MKSFLLCFVPLFVAVDAVGVLPLFLGLTHGVEPRRLRSIILQSVLTAGAVALLFVGAGPAVMRLLGITPADFMVAGGVLLFAMSLSDLVGAGKSARRPEQDSLGAVPLGVPLITGPAVLTTTVLLVDQHGMGPTALAVVANVLIAGGVFSFAELINRLLGKAGTNIVSKVGSLLLAAIAVMMVRKGLTALLPLH